MTEYAKARRNDVLYYRDEYYAPSSHLLPTISFLGLYTMTVYNDSIYAPSSHLL
jgi:hypothetical protein